MSSVKGAMWVCRLVSALSSFVIKERFVWLQWLNSNQLPADSTLLCPGSLKDAVGLWSPTEQFWWFLSLPLTYAAIVTVSTSTREVSDEQGKAEELQGLFLIPYRNNSDLYPMPEFILDLVSLSQ